MQKRVFFSILKFMVLFGGIAFAQGRIFGLDRHVEIFTLLAIVAISLISLNRKTLSDFLSQSSIRAAGFAISCSVVAHLIVTFCILQFSDVPTWPVDSRGTSFLLMNKYFIFAKPLDVFVQQLLLLLLVLQLKKEGLTLRAITYCMLIGFGLLHFFQIFNSNQIMGLLYTLVASLFALIFPYLILRVKNGFIYNYLIHLAVYDVAALVAWFLF